MKDWLSNLFKNLNAAEGQATRSVSLICASIHVAAMNVAGVTRGAMYNGDDVVKEAKRFEKYLDKGV